jgi:hypothetical protein
VVGFIVGVFWLIFAVICVVHPLINVGFGNVHVCCQVEIGSTIGTLELRVCAVPALE